MRKEAWHNALTLAMSAPALATELEPATPPAGCAGVTDDGTVDPARFGPVGGVKVVGVFE